MSTEPAPPAPPAWVYERDGQLVPFEADKISRALFAASESFGQPDAFLARELADSIVHFLCTEADGVPTTRQIEELVIKVVRELGQPALAEAFAAQARSKRDEGGGRRDEAEPCLSSSLIPPPSSLGRGSPAAPGGEVVLRLGPLTAPEVFVREAVQGYTLQSVFTRDLVAAQNDGLLTLTGLGHPGELAGCVLGPRGLAGDSLLDTLEEVRRFTGRLVVLDGPEYLLAGSGRAGEKAVGELARPFVTGLRLAGLQGTVNLNCAQPPAWADDLAEGPLFAGQRRSPRPEDLPQVAEEFLAEFLEPDTSAARVRVDWHLGEHDFGPERNGRERLVRLVRLALAGASLGFVFDRPRRRVALAEGIDRDNPAVLLTVGLHLPRLAQQPGMDGEPGRFLQRLGSLARLALSAAVQKRGFLRRLERARPEKPSGAPAVTSGFLLDRARLVVAPVGLDHLVYTLKKRGLCAGGAALDFGRQVVQRLRDVLRQDGRAAHLETCLDGPFHFALKEKSLAEVAGVANEEIAQPATLPVTTVAGLTPWEGVAPVPNQLRAAGVLHGVAEHGTLALFLPETSPPSAEEVADCLHQAWQQTEVVRLRLLRAASPHRQLTLEG